MKLFLEMNVQLLLVIGTFAFLVKFTVNLVNWIRSPVRSVPGPFLARVTDLWYLYHVRQGSFEKVNIKLHEQYGRTNLSLHSKTH